MKVTSAKPALNSPPLSMIRPVGSVRAIFVQLVSHVLAVFPPGPSVLTAITLLLPVFHLVSLARRGSNAMINKLWKHVL